MLAKMNLGLFVIAVLATAALPAHALTNAPMPTDPATGAHMADQDDQFDDNAGSRTSTMNFGGTSMSFGGGNMAPGSRGQGGAEVQTGDQMYDPVAHFEGR